MNEEHLNEMLQTLKGINEEQQKQSKYLQNIYQIQVIVFALGLIACVVELREPLCRLFR